MTISFFSNQAIGGLHTRRGTIMESEVCDDKFTASAEVALNEMFGYSNQLTGRRKGRESLVWSIR